MKPPVLPSSTSKAWGFADLLGRRKQARGVPAPGPSTPVRHRRGGGVVAILVAMFVLSGGLRLIEGFDQARSLASAAFAADPPPASMPLTAECPPIPVELSEALRLREERVQAREARIAGRESELGLAQQLLEARLLDLTEAEAQLSATIARVDGAAEGDIERLARVFEAMKPKEASALFEEMAPDFAAGFLVRLRPETAGAILAGMSSASAYVLSLTLAGRNATAPRN